MARIVVRIPEPKNEYDASNQRQINRGIASLIVISLRLFNVPLIIFATFMLKRLPSGFLF